VSLEVQEIGSPEGKGSISSKERRAQLQAKLAELEASLVVSPEKLTEFVNRWKGGFRNYSLHNFALILWQKPESTICAGFHQWRAHKRWVRKGERAIWVLAPGFARKIKRDEEIGDDVETEERVIQFFFPVPVFDVSQTDGAELAIGNTAVHGNGSLLLDEVKKAFPEFEWRESNGIEDGSTDGKSIKVSERANKAQMVCAGLHEVGHCLCGHLDGRKDTARDIQELEAEAVSFLVSSFFGFEDEGAKLYLVNWHGDKAKLAKSGSKVLSVAERIIKRLRPDDKPKSRQAEESASQLSLGA
jgi:hypothetical protein